MVDEIVVATTAVIKYAVVTAAKHPTIIKAATVNCFFI